MPAIGRTLPKESIDDEVHLDLTVGGGRAIRPLPMYDPARAPGHKNGHDHNRPAGGNEHAATERPKEHVH
jgi:hypothetical protein